MTNWKKLIYSGSDAFVNNVSASSMHLSGIGDVSESVALALAGGTLWQPVPQGIAAADNSYAVGIGTDTPSYKLDVYGGGIKTTTLEGNKIAYYDGNGIGAYSSTGYGIVNYYGDLKFTNNADDKDIIFNTSAGTNPSAEIMRIDGSSGNVGIGTTEPYLPFHVVGNARIEGNLMAGNAAAANAPAAPLHIKNSGTAFIRLEDLDAGNSIYDISVDQGGGFSILEDSNTRLFIEEGGYVGINATNPGTTLEVRSPFLTGAGLADITGSVIGTYGLSVVGNGTDGIQLLGGSNAEVRVVFGDKDNGHIGRISYDNATNDMKFITNTTEKMRITDIGEVGIGTNTPARPLQVAYYSTTAPGFSIKNINATADNNVVMAFNRDGSDELGWSMGIESSDDSFKISESGNNVENNPRITILPGGNVGIGNANPPKTLTVYGDISASGDLYIYGSTVQAGDLTLVSSSFNIETFGEGVQFYNGTNYTSNRIKLTHAQNLQYLAAGSHQFDGQSVQILHGKALIFEDADNTDSIRLRNNVAAEASGARLDITDESYTPIMSISSSGNVGIGRSNPGYSLDFGTNSSTIRLVSEHDGTAIRIGAGGGSNNVTLLRVDGETTSHNGSSDNSKYGFSLKYMGNRSGNDNSLSIFSDNQTGTAVEALTILQDGHIGIGAIVPNRQLHVKDTGATVAVKIEAADSSQASVDLQNSEGAFRIVNDGGALDFYDDDGSDISRMYIRSGSGNVGIGTTTPAEKLDINGNLLTRGDIVSRDTYPSIYVDHSGTVMGGIRADATNKLELKTLTDAPISFQVNSSEKMRITPVGLVGIGTVNPKYTLDVAGTSRIAGTIHMYGAVRNYSGDFSLQNGVQDADILFKVNDGGTTTTAMMIDGTNSRVGIGTTSPGERLEVIGNISASGYISASAIRIDNDAQIAGDLGIGGNIFGLTGFGITIDDVAVVEGSTNFGSGSNPTTTIHSRTGSMSITGSTFTFNGENVLTDTTEIYWHDTGTQITSSKSVGISGSMHVQGDITASSLSIVPEGTEVIEFAASASTVDGVFTTIGLLNFAGSSGFIGHKNNVNASSGITNNGIQFNATDNSLILGGQSFINIKNAQETAGTSIQFKGYHDIQFGTNEAANIMFMTQSHVEIDNARITGSLEGTASVAVSASHAVSALTASYALNASDNSVWYDGTTYISSSVNVKITGSLDITDNQRDLLKLHNTTNTKGAGIIFSDQTTSNQSGSFYYAHADADSNRAYNSFHFDSNQGRTAVIINETVGDSGYYIGSSDAGLDVSQFKVAIRGSQSSSFMGGNVGIGIVNPNTPLHIAGANTSPQLTIENTSGGGGNAARIIFKPSNTRDAGPYISSNARGVTSANGDIRIGDETGDIMTINDGNVGIGQTSPSSLLELKNVSYMNFITMDRTDNTNIDQKVYLTPSYDGTGNTAMHIIIGESPTYARFAFTEAGRVGIGTTSPADTLEVVGGIRAQNAILTVGPDSAALGQVAIGEHDGQLQIRGNSGTLTLGPQEGQTNFTHIEASVGKFYFNKEVIVDEGIVSSYDEDLILRRVYNDTGTDKNNQITIGDDSLEIKLDNSPRLSINGDGKLTLGAYGSGTHTGTVAKSLGVDSLGNVIEFDAATTDADTLDGIDATSFLRSDQNDTFTGTIFGPRLRLTSTDDATVSSTGHALQIGLDNSTNVIFDGNEIMARNNGAVATLNLNPDGGAVTINNNTEEASFTIGGHTVWHAGNDGANSGLDADTLDGLNASDFLGVNATATNAANAALLDNIDSSQFLRSDTADTATGLITLNGGLEVLSGTGGGKLRIKRNDSSTDGDDIADIHLDDTNWYFDFDNDDDNDSSDFKFRFKTGDSYSNLLTFNNSTIQYKGNTILTTANEGSGNGIDADTVDGVHADALKKDTHTSFYPGNDLAVGWYTIAVIANGRAHARFGIRDQDSSRHASVTFYATHHYGNGNQLTVLTNGKYGTEVFGKIRIKESGTYDGAALQVYISNAANSVTAFLLGDNYQTSGWTLKNWIPDATDPGVNTAAYSSAVWTAYTSAAEVDLSDFQQGMAVTPGPISGSFKGDGSNLSFPTRVTIGSHNTFNENTLTVRHSGADHDQGIMILREDGTTTTNELLGGIGFDSSDGGIPSQITEASAYIAAYAAESQGPSDKGGYLEFGTSKINDDDDTASHPAMRINHDQKVHFVNDIIAFSTTVSDQRLKTNIQLLTGSLDTICNLEGVRYDWKYRDSGPQLGVIAQQVEPHVPEIIKETELPLHAPSADDDTKYKTVDYEQLVPHLIEAIKELKTKVDELKSRLSNG
jgi:hypothetical protein